MGDAAGTGPELLTRALANPQIRAACRPVVIGDTAVMQAALAITKVPATIRPIKAPGEASDDPCTIDVLNMSKLPQPKLVRGQINVRNGSAAFDYIKFAVELTQTGQTHAVVTSAIDKNSLSAAGYYYNGHTEILAKLTNSPQASMMLVAGKLRVCHISANLSLRESINRVRTERIVAVVRLAYAGMRELGVADPHIAIAGLNPNAGENGLFGDEDTRQIVPAVAEAKRLGFLVSGPHASDTVFFRTLCGDFACAIAMYHDQGHVAAKMFGPWQGAKVTLGLPIVHTSVGNGADFANAGTGCGDPSSLLEALRLATTMAGNRLRATNPGLNTIVSKIVNPRFSARSGSIRAQTYAKKVQADPWKKAVDQSGSPPSVHSPHQLERCVG